MEGSVTIQPTKETQVLKDVLYWGADVDGWRGYLARRSFCTSAMERLLPVWS